MAKVYPRADLVNRGIGYRVERHRNDTVLAIFFFVALLCFGAKTFLAGHVIRSSTNPPVRLDTDRTSLLPTGRSSDESPSLFPSADSAEDARHDAATDESNLPATNLLSRIRFMANNKLFTLADVDKEARVWLAKDGIPPPQSLGPTFEVEDGQIFIRVRYLQGVGKKYWFVNYDRKLEVNGWGWQILKERRQGEL